MATAPPRPIRLAILECDTPLPGTVARFQTFGGVFADMFARAVAPAPLDSVLHITKHDVVTDGGASETYPSLEAVDAVLVTGAKHSAFDDTPWIVRLVEYVRAALDTGRVRVVGVCFGHQVVGRALGAVVARNERGWEVSVTEVRLTGRGKEVFGRDTLKIHQMHRDIVTSLPEGSELLGETDVCEVQGFLVPGRAITVQGHPEFSSVLIREILDIRHAAGVHSDELYKTGIERADQEHDGVLIAQAFMKFLQQ